MKINWQSTIKLSNNLKSRTHNNPNKPYPTDLKNIYNNKQFNPNFTS